MSCASESRRRRDAADAPARCDEGESMPVSGRETEPRRHDADDRERLTVDERSRCQRRAGRRHIGGSSSRRRSPPRGRRPESSAGASGRPSVGRTPHDVEEAGGHDRTDDPLWPVEPRDVERRVAQRAHRRETRRLALPVEKQGPAPGQSPRPCDRHPDTAMRAAARRGRRRRRRCWRRRRAQSSAERRP